VVVQNIKADDHLKLIAKLQTDIENYLISKEDHEMKALVYKT